MKKELNVYLKVLNKDIRMSFRPHVPGRWSVVLVGDLHLSLGRNEENLLRATLVTTVLQSEFITRSFLFDLTFPLRSFA
jgi:hypothetical protein